MFKNKFMSRTSGPKREKAAELGDNYIKRSFIICTVQQILPE
jgi:hypothetical protein